MFYESRSFIDLSHCLNQIMTSFRSAQVTLGHGLKHLCDDCSIFKRIVLASWISSGRDKSISNHDHIRTYSFEENVPREESDKNLIWRSIVGSDSDDLDKAIITKLGKKICYVKDHHVGCKLVQAIMNNRINPKAPILDIQAGPGIVCSEFLRQGVSQVIALEKRNLFKPQLSTIQEKFGSEKFQYLRWNMLNFFFKFNDQVKDENHSTYRTSERSVLNILSKSPYSNTGTPYSVFSTGGHQENQNVIFYIMRNLPHEDQILSTGRVEYFLIVHSKLKASIESLLPLDQPSRYTRQFSYFHIFMALLYDIKFIEEFQATDFVPPFLKSAKNGLNANSRPLMRLQIKENISEILPFEHHHAFSIFLRHIFQKRKARIIPAMEMLVSGCGLHMLASGFSMMDTVVDIAPYRLLLLYKDMVTWPEYRVSHLKNHIEMKTQGGLVENVETMHHL